ncbi:MAG TPA: SIR2 family protein, partial [Myxococcota bacterium]|nr:SIR2 family protein [Myxococcota bacterium]
EPHKPTRPDIALSPIRRLIEQVSANPEGWLDFKLEEVLDRKKHEGSMEEFGQFHRLFRRELYRRDFGFTYHHWLMARFRWTAIITTNFDGFHERAAASVARMQPQNDEARLWALSLGSVARDWSDRASRDFSKWPEKRGALGEHRLFKPYGSLYSPSGELLLSNDEIDALQSEFRIALETALRLEEPSGAAAPGAIVVVGHSMRDELVGRVLKELPGALDGFELVWVDPAAYDRCESPQTRWEQTLSQRKRDRALGAERDKTLYGGATHFNKRECSGPVPSRALDFIFDLWAHLRPHDEL